MTVAHEVPPRLDMRRAAAVGLATLSFGAAAIHFAVIAEHFDESALFGVFFVLVAWLQIAWGVLAISKQSRVVLSVGVVGNLAVAVIWALSRTVGLPVGPEPGAAEPVGFTDALATVFESLIVIAGALLIRAPSPPRTVSGRTARLSLAVVAIAVVSLTGASLAMLEGHGASHESEDQAAHLPVVPHVLEHNGQEVRIEGMGTARVDLRPYPPRSRTTLTLTLTLTLIGSDGHPLDAGEVHVSYDMKMPHGGSDTELERLSAGTYQTDLRFTMWGGWNLVFDVSAPDERHTFAVEVRVPFG